MARGFGTTFGAGTTDAITTGYSTVLSGGQRSYAVWVNIHADGGNGVGRILDAEVTSGTPSEMLRWWPLNGLTYAVAWSTAPSGFAEWGISQGSISYDTWYHFAVTYNSSSSSNTPVMYLNGVSQAPANITAPSGTLNPISTPFVIGNRQDGARNHDGKIAWPTIWDGVALNASEIAALAAGAMPFRVRPASIVCCVPCWGITSPEIDLKVANGTATVTGTARQNDPPTTLFTAKPPGIFVPPAISNLVLVYSSQ
jgi:hypothetical protein